jgi:hypothetical protein
VNLGDSGPDNGARLPVSLPEVLVSLLGNLRTGVIPAVAPVDASTVGDELTGNGCSSGCNSSSYIPVRMGHRRAVDLQGVAQQTIWNLLGAIS